MSEISIIPWVLHFIIHVITQQYTQIYNHICQTSYCTTYLENYIMLYWNADTLPTDAWNEVKMASEDSTYKNTRLEQIYSFSWVTLDVWSMVVFSQEYPNQPNGELTIDPLSPPTQPILRPLPQHTHLGPGEHFTKDFRHTKMGYLK